MADSSAVSFGGYLRLLRERRGLSLQTVSELMNGGSEAIDKGTLSRLERGQQTPSLFRLGPLCRIYDVPPGALIERMELDREVERIGRPSTSGKSYDELLRLGQAALVRGARKWDAYAYFRDALPLAGPDRRVAATSNVATAIRSLGKNELALHELRALESSPEAGPAERALLQERMSNCHRCLGDMVRAESYAESAAAQAREVGDSRLLAYAYNARANAAIDREQWEVAAEFLKQALTAYRDAGQRRCLVLPSPAFEAQTMIMLGDCTLRLGHLARARRLALVAKGKSHEHDLPLALAYSELLLGRLDEREGESEKARQRWSRAALLATSIDNRRLAFTIELELYRQARHAGDAARARASRRRLERLAPWVPKHTPAVREFDAWTAEDRSKAPNRNPEGEMNESASKASDAPARVRLGRIAAAGGPGRVRPPRRSPAEPRPD